MYCSLNLNFDFLSGFAEENLQKMSPDELTKYDEIINGKHMEWDLYYYFTGR
jgi:succinate dehydrogenase flavin-adding protein (antitoxin of CptAB toxin-antitoxin module)